MAHLLKKVMGHDQPQTQQQPGMMPQQQQQPFLGQQQPQQMFGQQQPQQMFGQQPQQQPLGTQQPYTGQPYGQQQQYDPLKQQQMPQQQYGQQGGMQQGQQTLGWLGVQQQFDQRSLSQVTNSEQFTNGRIDYLHLGGLPIAVYHFGPGFNWQQHLAPKFGTQATNKLFVGFIQKGRLEAQLPDGRRFYLEPNTFVVIPPGSNLIASEEVILVDWNGEIDAMRRKTSTAM